jgi:ribosomal 50S subunit-recycling heat shock protein
MAGLRLDQLLVERGLAASRDRAQRLIRAGQVRVGGKVVDKPGTKSMPDAVLELLETKLVVRLDSAVGSDTSRIEDPVEAILSDAVVIDGVDAFPAGSVVRGEVAAVQPSGKVKGRASLALRFTSVSVAGRDERSAMMARTSMRAPDTKRDDAVKIGIPAAGGAIIGGIVGGKKGAAIGTAVGGGGGAAVVLATSGEEIRLGRGAVLTLSLDQAIEVRVPTTNSP